MGATGPLVSAIIPVYNQERYLGSAIDSVLGQTFRDFELIVVDDGSTDRTPEVIASYGSRVRAFRKPNGGGASALNLGIREARGEWIAWLSSDDLWEPTKLERQVAAIRGNPSAALLYTDVLQIDAEGHALGRQHFPCPADPRERAILMVRRCFINGSSTLIRGDVFTAVGLFDEADRLTPDYDMWLRVVGRYEVVHIPEPLIRYRIHPGQTSANVHAMQRSGRRVAGRALRRMGPGLGAWGALLRLKDEVAVFPWRVQRKGGNQSISGALEVFADTFKALANPGTP